MTRLLCFAVAMGLSTAAHAETFSFAVGGHHISISAASNCYRASCISVSVRGVFTSHRRHSDNVVTVAKVAPARPVPQALAVAAPVPVTAPAPAPQIAPATPPAETRVVATAPAAPPAPSLAATGSKDIAAPPSPPAAPVNTAATDQPVERVPLAQPGLDKLSAEAGAAKPPVTPPSAAALPAPDPAPVLKVAKVVDIERDDTPLGDWQTEGKIGAVRIEACGKTLCGYLINPSSHAKAETILINMRPNSDTEWRGSIFSRASGNTYNAIMTLKGANLLRVEACAIGHFFCSGNNWARIVRQPAALVTSRADDGGPRS
ncbi:DUF2147 domain-containing protein [Bradyrhizobium sp. Tv2a-2]|uniref:DUF2147 domain-containing protein n=1 Tax=Bradyrhizobium sp. Tv2a-2 TaxID=113395 RepID=UPI000462F716|nr:DUF2147 domain-containing protein [Bradyrhizobium sp. Tv2a-2]